MPREDETPARSPGEALADLGAELVRFDPARHVKSDATGRHLAWRPEAELSLLVRSVQAVPRTPWWRRWGAYRRLWRAVGAYAEATRAAAEGHMEGRTCFDCGGVVGGKWASREEQKNEYGIRSFGAFVPREGTGLYLVLCAGCAANRGWLPTRAPTRDAGTGGGGAVAR